IEEDPPPRKRATPAALPGGKAEDFGGPKGDGAQQYKALRQRLDKLRAQWNVEKKRDTGRYFIRCEVPHPTDAELAQVFEVEDADEIAAMRAVVLQAERWLETVRRKAGFDDYAPDRFDP
ncbi:MAG TPA: hypothetical protein VNC50_17255, partial [Planctomycetia bacterium]|nr:hypothetical protein [Planctomycetia bacterium]